MSQAGLRLTAPQLRRSCISSRQLEHKTDQKTPPTLGFRFYDLLLIFIICSFDSPTNGCHF